MARIEIDGREMQPPEPLERTLAALETMHEEDELVLLVYCHPRPLISILQRDGCSWQEEVLADGTHQLRIQRGPAL